MMKMHETLESRRLFSVVNVANYNVDPSDASGAIQAAFNASRPGDTILFPAGTYQFSRQMTIPGNRILQGNNAVLIASGTSYCFQNDRTGNANSLKLTGFEVKGRFLRIESWAGWSNNIEIANNLFDPANFYSDGGSEHQSIFITNGGRNINVHNNTANGTIGDGWIVGYGAQNVNITDNVIENMNEGIHFLGQYGVTKGLTISRNLFVHNHTMNVEVQGSGSGLLVEGNIVQGAWITTDFNDNMNSFGFSLSGEGFSGTIVDHNKVITYDRADGTGLREAFEIAGANPKVFQNDIEGTNQAGVLQTSTNGSIHDNRVVGAFQGFTAYSGRTPGATLSNNTTTTRLDWNPAKYALPNAGVNGKAASPPPSPAGTPFGGAPISLPGVLQAEDFDTDPQGVAFETPAAGNNGAGYRDTPITLEQTTDIGGGYDVGNVVQGQWLAYTINVPATGRYSLNIRFASGNDGGTVHLESDGTTVLGPISLPSTGGWQSWQTFTTSGVTLTKGLHVLKLFVDSSVENYIGNFNWISLTRS